MPAGEILDLFVTFVEDSSQLKGVCWFIGIGSIEDDISIRQCIVAWWWTGNDGTNNVEQSQIVHTLHQ